jgi:hypothetical protein
LPLAEPEVAVVVAAVAADEELPVDVIVLPAADVELLAAAVVVAAVVTVRLVPGLVALEVAT